MKSEENIKRIIEIHTSQIWTLKEKINILQGKIDTLKEVLENKPTPK